MNPSRRDLSALLPVLAVYSARAAENTGLPSKAYSFESLPVRTDPKNGAEYRDVFRGMTHEGMPIDLHITTMPTGEMPHPSHHHPHEEMMLVQTGQLAVTIAGSTSTVGPGSVIYIHSNEEHGIRSVGDVPAQYFVLAFGHQKT